MLLKTSYYTLIIVLIVGLISGCNDSGMSDLDDYVKKINARKNREVPPIPPFIIAPSYIYPGEKERDPFTPLETYGPPPPPPPPPCTEEEIKRRKEGCEKPLGPVSCNRPDPYRVRNDLERIPLDVLKMVGILKDGNQSWALIEEKLTGIVHLVQPGGYMGQNYGQVINVAEDKIELQEQYPDSNGCYTEQTTELPLNDKK